MSANTYVTQRLWRRTRQVVAGMAGILITTTGATTTALAVRDLGGFEVFQGFGRVDLKAAPAGVVTLSEHESAADAARLSDQAVTDGLQPGEAAYFGYTLALGAHSVPVAAVTMEPSAVNGDRSALSYEVRKVSDATQCRRDWSAGEMVVAPRAFSDPASESFGITRLGASPGPTQLCIKVSLAATASAAHTGSVTWRFLATPAT